MYFGKRIVFDRPDEQLVGSINGLKASDIEERWARGVAKLPEWSYQFRARISPLTHKVTSVMRNLPGELELDFLMAKGTTVLPILIDGEIGHFYSAWQRDVDEKKTIAINQAMTSYKALPAIRVPQRKDELWRLSSQEYTDKLVKDILMQF